MPLTPCLLAHRGGRGHAAFFDFDRSEAGDVGHLGEVLSVAEDAALTTGTAGGRTRSGCAPC